MNHTKPIVPVPFVAEITNVREVSLLGTADLGFWKGPLREAKLVPIEKDGQALLLISAMASRFLGVPFRELAIAVMVGHTAGAKPEGLYLERAFNTSRLFTFIERNWFTTPYEYGKVDVDVAIPASFRLEKTSGLVLRAEMSAEVGATSREPVRAGDECWEGPIYLPGPRGSGDASGKYFYARIAGQTRTYPYNPGDVLEIKPTPGLPVLQRLVDSGFTGKEWAIRAAATHARSKTKQGSA
jgi:hypothetical protein